ncbi:hypothetical protein B0H10DRAFT_2440418 [Mycena sp. CBHHK59/15]|nr:hypothetical protein B0H10DRAFT_2440418 [Mycena sp. CBHHK59/15]
MDLAASPLATQELVDHCIGFLHDSAPDLAACALVRRAWVREAQSHLFNSIRLTHTVCRATTEKRCRRFLELVGESPHLIRLSSRLEVETSLISQHSLWNLANVPFTHLRELHVYHNFGHLSHEVFSGIQKLFSLSTLQAVALQCNMDCEEGAPGIFKGLWNGCSPSVKHLGLSCTPVKSIVKAPPIQPSTASSRIDLESLHITYAGDISDWLQDSQCPFDFSHLKTLCIYTDTTVPCYNPFVTILGNIQCLDFAACLDCPTFDLGKFTQLSVLRLSIPRSADLPMALETLSTIPPHGRIQRIELYSTFLWADDYHQLDKNLFALPVPTVELDRTCKIGSFWCPITSDLPLLHSRHALRVSSIVDSLLERW